MPSSAAVMHRRAQHQKAIINWAGRNVAHTPISSGLWGPVFVFGRVRVLTILLPALATDLTDGIRCMSISPVRAFFSGGSSPPPPPAHVGESGGAGDSAAGGTRSSPALTFAMVTVFFSMPQWQQGRGSLYSTAQKGSLFFQSRRLIGLRRPSAIPAQPTRFVMHGA
jgi:hypothetical protein